MKTCVYRERERECRETVIVTVKVDGRETPLCKRHIEPSFWPPDLQKKLPGRIKRALMGAP